MLMPYLNFSCNMLQHNHTIFQQSVDNLEQKMFNFDVGCNSSLSKKHTLICYGLINPRSPKGGLQQPPKQFSSRCSKTCSQGVKFLHVPLRSFFPLLAVEKIRTYHLPLG